MTAAEVVACIRDLDFLSGLVRERVWNNDDQHVGAVARLAFHEAGRLFDACAPKTCGTCADYIAGQCDNSASPVASALDYVPEDFGCCAWRKKA